MQKKGAVPEGRLPEVPVHPPRRITAEVSESGSYGFSMRVTCALPAASCEET